MSPKQPSSTMSATSTASASSSSSSAAAAAATQPPVRPPTPAMTHTARAASQRPAADDFFGGSLSSSSRTRDSRHDRDTDRQSLADVPPPYAAEAAIPLPEYTLHAPEPVTLAMYLFKFGFLFPPFWLFGAIILLSPLREPPMTSTDDQGDNESMIPAWMPEKTEEERRRMIADIRRVELKWAGRCLCAFVILVALVTAAAIAAWLVLRS